MSAETLVTAAHRLNRFFRVDMRNGLVVDETILAHLTLTREIELARKGKEHDHALLVAAVNAARDFAIDTSEHGGMVSAQTEISFDTLDKAIRAAGGREAAR